MAVVLLVEDDRTLAEGIALALADDALRLVTAPDVATARRLFAHEAVDLIILDINLPDGSGL